MNFDLQVYVQRRPHMRDENLEYALYLGKSILRQIFDEERVDSSVTEAVFFFPERWMNIVEERSLYERLELFCPNLKTVTITTQSVYIIQSTPSDKVFILSSEDEQERIKTEGKLTQESSRGRLWYKNSSTLDFTVLQVL